MIIVSYSIEIFMKTIGMEIIKKICGDKIKTVHLAVIIIALASNLFLYAWAGKLFFYKKN